MSSSRSRDGSTRSLAALTGIPRADVQRAIAAGRVTVDGETRPTSFRLHGRRADRVPTCPSTSATRAGGRSGADPLPRRAPPRGREAGGAGDPPDPNAPDGTLVNRLLGMDVPLAAVGWCAASRHRPSAGRRHQRAHRRRMHRPEAFDGLQAALPGHQVRSAGTSRSCAGRPSTTRSRSTRRWAGARPGSSWTGRRAGGAETEHPGPGTARPGRASSTPRRGPAGPTRSACTSRRSDIRSWGTAPTEGRATRPGASGSPPVPALVAALALRAPGDRRGRSRWRSRSPADLASRAGSSPVPTCDLDAPWAGRSFGALANHTPVSSPHRRPGGCGKRRPQEAREEV